MKPTDYRERIYDIFADPTQAVQDKIQSGLRVGTEYLGLPIGFFTRIRNGTQVIVQATGDHHLIQPGESCPLDKAYCRRTVELDSVLAIQNAGTSTAVPDVAVETFDLGTYIGAKVTVEDETYGTVCFADTDVRTESFTDTQTHLVELLASLVGHAKEREKYERELAEREAEIHKREENYRSLIDASFDLVLRIDMHGAFTYISPTIEDLLGYEPEEYIGRPFTVMLPDTETITLAQDIFERVTDGETVEEHYFPLVHEDGRRVFTDIRVTPIYQSGLSPKERTSQDIIGVQGTVHDATDRYRRERLIRVLNRVLRHNLRNDMNVITGYADLLRDRLADENSEFADRIQKVGDGLVRLSETARELEQNIQDPPEIVAENVVPYVTRTATHISGRYPDVEITVETPDTAVAKTAPRLETALVELVDNAAKHAGDQPSVQVELTTTETETVIRIADDGPGLPEEERRVLTSGEETPLVHGSGLGLWLVYWIVNTIDGTLRVCDNSGGTCIEIRLRRVLES